MRLDNSHPWQTKTEGKLRTMSWKVRAEVAADLKSIYTSATADEAEQQLQ